MGDCMEPKSRISWAVDEEHSVFIWYGQQTEISLSWGTHIIGLFLNNPYLKTEAIKDGSLKGW